MKIRLALTDGPFNPAWINPQCVDNITVAHYPGLYDISMQSGVQFCAKLDEEELQRIEDHL